MPIFAEINVKITIRINKVCFIVTMSALIRKASGPKAAASAELDRLRALRRIVIYQDDLDVIDQSISQLEQCANAGFHPAGLASASAATASGDVAI